MTTRTDLRLGATCAKCCKPHHDLEIVAPYGNICPECAEAVLVDLHLFAQSQAQALTVTLDPQDRCFECGAPMNPAAVMLAGGNGPCRACVKRQHRETIGR